ncbi:MAG: hypothetical protein ABI592_08880 [Acidobacteriota bacterium]
MSTAIRETPGDFQEAARWQKAAHAAIQDLVRRDRPFTANDLVKMVGAPPSRALLPSFMRWAKMSRLIVKCAVVTGAVWKGADSRRDRGEMRSRVGTPQTAEETETWSRARSRAADEHIDTPELVLRALRSYLKRA